MDHTTELRLQEWGDIWILFPGAPTILEFMRIPRALQHRVLFCGILGAIVWRGTMILAGAALIAHFSWVTYLLGGALVFSAASALMALPRSALAALIA
jgi:predicted tellurium resistance membrane protein TerC